MTPKPTVKTEAPYPPCIPLATYIPATWCSSHSGDKGRAGGRGRAGTSVAGGVRAGSGARPAERVRGGDKSVYGLL